MKRIITTFLALGVLLGMAATANADLIGQTVNVSYRFPNVGTIYNGNSVDVVVGAGVEITDFPVGDPRTNIDLTADQIIITFNSAGTWTGTAFNGLRFADVLNGFDFISASVNAATNMAGLSNANLALNADVLLLNWAGLSFTRETIVILDVMATPEPGTLALLGIGLLGIGAARRRRTA